MAIKSQSKLFYLLDIGSTCIVQRNILLTCLAEFGHAMGFQTHTYIGTSLVRAKLAIYFMYISITRKNINYYALIVISTWIYTETTNLHASSQGI